MNFEIFKVAGASATMPSSRLSSDEMVVDNLAAMLKQESSYYCPCFDYLSVHRDLQPSNEHVNENWRRKICEWAFEVTDHFRFDREVVSIALNYLDRVIAHTTETSKERVPRKKFQLVAVTALYLATKLHGQTDAVEGAPRKLRINAFVELSRGMFTIEDLENMEKDILSNLEWNVNPPTTVSFLAYFLRLLPGSFGDKALHASVASSIFEMARYLTELSVCVSTFSFQFKSSEIAYAAILCAIDALHISDPLAYGVRIAFLDSVANLTSLTPGKKKIRKCRDMIMELVPELFDEKAVKREKKRESSSGMFDDNGPLPEPSGSLSRSTSIASEGGSCSPVCVSEQIAEDKVVDKNFCRKRPRSHTTSN